MTRLLRPLPSIIAACLCLASGSSLAASAPLTEELLAPLTSAYVKAVKPGEEAELHRNLFATVLRRVERSYAQEVDMRALVAAALKVVEPLQPQSGEPVDVFRKAMNAALGSLDPHSRYLDARAHSHQRSAMTGSFGGLGLQVELVDGLLRVVETVPDTPAARAGLLTGDVIVRLDDAPVHGIELTDAVSRMRGQPGTPIALAIRRAGREDEFTVPLVRETIRTQAVRWNMEGDVLVLRLATFTTSVVAALEKAVAEATALATARAIVLDMRGNRGGLLDQAIIVADAFLREGEIVSLRGRTAGNRRTWHADRVELLPGLPMVVLIDGRSASAAELVAAALQENGRATVMGQRSFGKGSVQSIVSLGSERGALRLTTALYHGPSGRPVQRTGVGPDIELLVPAAGVASRREADRTQALPGADEPPPPKARVEESRCVVPRKDFDAALACALSFLHTGRIESFVAALEPLDAASVR